MVLVLDFRSHFVLQCNVYICDRPASHRSHASSLRLHITLVVTICIVFCQLFIFEHFYA